MIYEIDESCKTNCLRELERDAMIEHWQEFETTLPATHRIVEEGVFRCPGAKEWSLGPIVLGYTCQATEVFVPLATPVSLNNPGNQ